MATAAAIPKQKKKAPYYALSDRELVERARRQDEVAFTEITARYRKRLLFTVYRLTGDWNTAEDLVQEVLIKAYRNLKKFNPHYAFSTWIYTIARHAAYDHLKRSRARMISIDAETDDGESTRSRIELADESGNPVEVLEIGELSEKVEAALLDLPSPYREAMELRHLEWKTYSEIAESLDIPIGTVKSYLFRGRKELQRKLSSVFGPLKTRPSLESERVALAS